MCALVFRVLSFNVNNFIAFTVCWLLWWNLRSVMWMFESYLWCHAVLQIIKYFFSGSDNYFSKPCLASQKKKKRKIFCLLKAHQNVINALILFLCYHKIFFGSFSRVFRVLKMRPFHPIVIHVQKILLWNSLLHRLIIVFYMYIL